MRKPEKYKRINRAGISFITAVCICMMLAGCNGKDRDTLQEIPAEDIKEISINDISDKKDTEAKDDTTDNTMLNVEAQDAVSYSEIPADKKEEEEDVPEKVDEEEILRTDDGRIIVDLVYGSEQYVGNRRERIVCSQS